MATDHQRDKLKARPDEYKEFMRFKAHRRSFSTAELSDEKREAIAASRMDPQHEHLDTLLDPK
jgi:hypothetical protein